MSRVGKLPVAIPEGVNVELTDDNITIKGKLGELNFPLAAEVVVTYEAAEKVVVIKPANDTKRSRALWGTVRSVISNMVQGVSEGFTTRLEINGVGFRAQADNKFLTLNLGYSHEIKYAIPEGIGIKCVKPTLLEITGSNKQLVGQIAGEIIKLRPVEPYKGKGVYKEGAYIRRKEGKKK